MGLVNELQHSASVDDVLTLLRKAKRVSTKLGRKDIDTWLNHELKGYPKGVDPPLYRHVTGTFCFQTNGYIPAGFGYMMNGMRTMEHISFQPTRKIIDPISTIQGWIAILDKGDGLFEQVEPQIANSLRRTLKCEMPDILNQLSFHMRLDGSQIRDIPEHIKTQVLDWACDLEAAGITGADQTFSADERNAAKTIIFNISNSTIDQLNSAGTNVKPQ